MTFLTVFATVFALDFIWTRYIAAVAEKEALCAAAWSCGTIVLGGYAAVQYVQDPTLLVPAGAAAFAATYLAVTRDKSKE